MSFVVVLLDGSKSRPDKKERLKPLSNRKDKEMAKYKKITVAELKKKLLNLSKGANIVTVQTITPAKMNKGGRGGVAVNPFIDKGIQKVSMINCQLQSDYENVVNNQLAREGKAKTFTAAARVWGSRVNDTSVVEHNGEFYMAYRALKCLRTRLMDAKGRFVSEDAVKPWISKPSKAKRQGTDTEIVWRTPKLSNIRKIHINRKRYEVVQG